ncbi:PDZ domain-containing protein [Paenibacillus thermoaerophilus]|nr:trypsin-like peptidase domain-containing protein [Paenibacillus thermoaerophilus]TMV06610.1 PDZ domain-containing protein [Paenibacillus thermoaerophilus]
MSLFDDDFYSTRTSNAKRWSVKPERPGSWLLGVALVAAGAFLMLVALWMSGVLGGRGGSHNGESSDERVIAAVEKVLPTVVSIISKTTSEGKDGKPDSYALGIGSGVIFGKKDGKALIVTNNHVVQYATEVEIVLSSGEHRQGKIVGMDLFTDLAVVETDDKGIKQVAEFGDSERLRPGETAIAIGSPLGLGLSQSITTGVISGPQRRIPVSLNMDGRLDWEMDVIQTDAAINQGNSGGALVNLSGKVIGINSMKISDTGVEGLGFALPIHQVKPVLESLLQYGKVLRPKMGIRMVDLSEYENPEALKLPESVEGGLIVIEVLPGPSLEAGMQTGDIIVELDGKPVRSTLELRQYLYSEKKIGDKLKVTYYRDGKKNTVTIKLEEY